MKGTEKIIAHIEADAQAKADEIFAAAERKCAEIKEKYEEKAANLYTDKIRLVEYKTEGAHIDTMA